MGSLNYGVFGKPFSLEGAFRVLRMESLPSGNFYYDEVAECGAATNATDLRALIAKANSLRFVDFGNGLIGLHGECDGFMFCVVREFGESGITEEQRPTQLENSDEEEPF